MAALSDGEKQGAFRVRTWGERSEAGSVTGEQVGAEAGILSVGRFRDRRQSRLLWTEAFLVGQ